jgi:hypothetical protein
MTSDFEFSILLPENGGSYIRRFKGPVPTAGDSVTLVVNRQPFHLTVDYTSFKYGEGGLEGCPHVHLKTHNEKRRPYGSIDPELLAQIKDAFKSDPGWTKQFA